MVSCPHLVSRTARVAVALLLLALAGNAAIGAPEVVLKPGDYVWQPELAPRGPVLVVVSLPAQRAYVYRNGVRIGVSTISSGKPGHETPVGVFTILQKSREHRSNLYDDAPMPFMQRLTWDGVALHAGRVPGYPASHGCIRLPYAFAERLFATTARGMTVVVADARTPGPAVASPGWFAPLDPGGEPVQGAVPLPAGTWQPMRAPAGPVTVVVGLHDREVVVLRQGREIGRAPLQWEGALPAGTRAWVLLEGTASGRSPVVPGRPALRWLALPAAAPASEGGEGFVSAVESGRLHLPPAFATQVYDVLEPGATVVVTDEPLGAVADAADAGAADAASEPVLDAVVPGPGTPPDPGDAGR